MPGGLIERGGGGLLQSLTAKGDLLERGLNKADLHGTIFAYDCRMRFS